VGAAIIGGAGIFGEKRRGYPVHPLIGALGAEDGGHQQLQGVVEIEGNVHLGVMLIQKLEYRSDFRRRLHDDSCLQFLFSVFRILSSFPWLTWSGEPKEKSLFFS